MKIAFRGRTAFPEGTIRNYGKYGRYRKVGKKWIRLKNGYPTFRKTLDFHKMKRFLLMKNYKERFFKDKGVKALRELIKSQYQKEYDNYVGGTNETATNSST